MATIANADGRELAATENLGRELAGSPRWLVNEAAGDYKAGRARLPSISSTT
ncbi:hypothetical protein [Microbulbifer sp.]|uniref:hypothetical protein n=1 Tax=Microbulbifer sp. TaxID=1908541 RepID=UPI003F37EE80